jgi:ribose 5-phosphate isomerase A
MDWRENAKRAAALEAVKHVQDGFILGLGSGTTVAYAIKEIGRRIREDKLNILGVPTSHQAFLLALENDVPITTLDEHPQLDLTIDGIDQVDKKLNLIKGRGGALAREKIVSFASKKNIRIADETKLTGKLGTDQSIPLEILPFAYVAVTLRLQKIGGKPVLREGNGKIGPAITDNGNFILDVYFGPIDDPTDLDTKLKSIPGVLETGLFLNLADIVYVGTRAGTAQKLESK